ncbi:Uncharacterised protein (plasmid) [Tsukamurella tyrosinosolvens]|uniref:Uncharacterized protein n=1 Tax=Tsukamurella tyrosinosolvens TaxID=57704 RepID=A0A1H5AZR8_TSUTY|nr:hypothetical protein [Tsukamurella tyrosinosolvens]SED47304.1 hypothetical protein SAMN04489793_5045 [Tsukamurella tyrosinosolvens]VEH88848.1 Uncharacterised protein [Tsukamurella tyrosinosolvens]
MHHHSTTTDEIHAAQIRVRMACCCREQPHPADVEFLKAHGALTDELAEMISFVP